MVAIIANISQIAGCGLGRIEASIHSTLGIYAQKGCKTMTTTNTSTVATDSTSTVATDSENTKKGTNMKNSNKRNRSSKRDAVLTSKAALYESAARSAQSDRQAANDEADEQARKGHRTFEQVCVTFNGLNEELDSHVSNLLVHTGVLDADTMLQVEGLNERDAWLNQSAAHKIAVAMMKGMLNRVPRRDENGQVVRFQEGHRLAGKVVLVREGTRSLPEFNDGSENAPHGDKRFTTTECAAIHGAFWSKWEQHPVVAAIVKQHEDFQNERQIETANRGRKNAKTFTKNEVASPEEVREIAKKDEGFNVMSAALEGVAPTHQEYTRKDGKSIKRRIPRRKSDKSTSAE